MKKLINILTVITTILTIMSICWSVDSFAQSTAQQKTSHPSQLRVNGAEQSGFLLIKIQINEKFKRLTGLFKSERTQRPQPDSFTFLGHPVPNKEEEVEKVNSNFSPSSDDNESFRFLGEVFPNSPDVFYEEQNQNGTFEFLGDTYEQKEEEVPSF